MNSEDGLLAYLASHKDVGEFIVCYPKEDWKQVILTVLLDGIHSLRTSHSEPPPLQALHMKMLRTSGLVHAHALIPSIKQQLSHMRTEIETIETQLDAKENVPFSYERSNLHRESINKKVTWGGMNEEIYPPWWIGLSETGPALAPQRSPSVRKVDFWNQTESKRVRAKCVEVSSQSSSERPSCSSSRQNPAWAADYTELLKKSPGQSPGQYKPPEYPVYEPSLKSSFPEPAGSSYTESEMSQYYPSEEMRQFYNEEHSSFLDSSAKRPRYLKGHYK